MNHHGDNTFAASVVTSVVTATVALIHSPAVTYIEKVVSVFVLAMAAEGGRRFFAKLVDRKPAKKDSK